MANEELTFIIIKFDEERSNMADAEGRLVVTEEGQVIEIFEGTMRSCINRQLEMLYDRNFVLDQLRVRRKDQ